MSSFKYSLAVDVIMLVMCAVLVISAALNEHIYDAGLVFKKTTSDADAATDPVVAARRRAAAAARRRAAAARGVARSTAAAEEEEVEGEKLRKSGALLGMTVESANTLSNVVTILGAAAFGMYALSLTHKSSGQIANKTPRITTTVIGFAVSVALILSGVMAHGLYNEIETFKDEKQDGAKRSKMIQNIVIALGASVPVLYTVKFIYNKKASPFRGGNAQSIFFTY